MTNDEKIIEMLKWIHHENCFILMALTNMVSHDDGIMERTRGITDAWDEHFNSIMEDKDE